MGKIATIGFFDGVHKGHRYLFEQLRKAADERGLQPLIVTFREHPRAVLQSDYIPHLLTSVPEREALLSRFGEVIMLPFADFQSLTAAEFMTYLRDRYEVTTLLMGYDHRFGSDRLKHPQEYRRAGEKCGIEVLTSGEYIDSEWHVSSTEIRTALEEGNIVLANELLGRPYAILGEVVHGKGIGHTIGFPTANIRPVAPEKITPKSGVYMVKVNTPFNDDTSAFANIDANGLIEVHIPTYKGGDLYGAQLKIRFIRFIREEKHFESLEELKTQIREDIDSILRPA